MAYEEYDYYNEPSTGSLKDSLYQILNGLQDRTKLREAGTSLKESLQLTPNVTESLGRGGVAQAIGTSGDLRDLSNTINSYLPKGVRNFTRAAEFLANPYATAIQQTAPTTEQTLDFVPRVTDPYEGYKQHETLGEYVAPALGYLGGKAAKAYANYVGPTVYNAIEDYMVKTGGIQQMMAGEKSLHPNFKAKEIAEKLEKKNADPIQIWDATGLMRGSDKKWRTEISDQFSKLKENPLLLDKERFTDKNYSDFGALYEAKLRTPGSYGRVHISDVFESPELEKYYPHLFDKRNPNGVTIKLAPKDARYMGRVEDEGRTISIRPGIKADDARRILNHEIQHIVQKYEGHATGGSPDTFTQQEDAKIAAQALSVRGEAERMDPNVPWPERVKASYVLHRGLGMDMPDEVRKVAENVTVNPTKDMENLTTLYGTDKNLDPYSPMKMYERIGGEAEARLTEARMDMTDAERAANFPYEYTPRTYDENLRPNPITGLDVRLEEQIIHGHKPNTIDIGGKRIFGVPDQKLPESVEIPQSEIDELGFHSPLENAILNIKQPKGTGEQFLKQLERTPGVKAEELEVTGLKQYLLDHPTVTKQQLQNYMDTNRVSLQNKVLDESMSGADTYDEYSLRGGDVYHDQDYINSTADDLLHDLFNDPEIYHQEQQALVERFPELYEGHELDPNVAKRLNEHVEEALGEMAQQQAKDMYYENPIRHYYDDHGYDIYGNDDMGYSVKDPNGRFLDLGGNRGIYDIDEAQDALRQHLLDEGVIDIGSEGGPKYEDYTLPGNYTNYREILTTIPENLQGNLLGSKRFNELQQMIKNGSMKFDSPEYKEYDSLVKQATNKKFESSHFDEPNVLAHMRVDDRVINGKKTLMVEEIQSDWHQKGRREGYATPISEERKMEIRLELDKIRDMNSYAMNQRDAAKAEGLSTINEDMRLANLKRQEMELRSELSPKGVPDAPFKKNWHELMMKQVLNEAVKGNYDAIAFTTGKQQAERYNLSKQIDSLDLVPAEEGVKQFVLSAYKDGRKIINKEVNEDELPDLIGKEAAKKLLEQEITKLHRPEGIAHGNPNVFKGRELSGLDLDVGGEGMKGFYDKILPDFVNKYTKKYGMGTKKANLDLPSKGSDLPYKNYDAYKKWATDKDPSLHSSFIHDSWEKQDDLYKQYLKEASGEEVHFVEITDAAKKDIKEKGQPLFSGIGLAAPALMMEDQDKTKK
jgi:hypothetical protein